MTVRIHKDYKVIQSNVPVHVAMAHVSNISFK